MGISLQSKIIFAIATIWTCNGFLVIPKIESSFRSSSSLNSIINNYGDVSLKPVSLPPVSGITISENTPTRRPILAGNWKLNPSTKDEAVELLRGLKASSNDVDIVVFPPLPFLSDALAILQGTGIKVGAQSASNYEEGAFTGEVAPSMLASAGCCYVLLGHSERRTLFGETDESINDRVKSCLKEPNLNIILCVGETLQEYEAGLLNSVVDTQVRKGLAGVTAEDLLEGRVVIAYEPVWAIGTGLVATPDQAQAAHIAVRQTLSLMYPSQPHVASSMRIQYGGSVKPDSIADLMAMPDVDGALVGGASLSADSFTGIVDGACSEPQIIVQESSSDLKPSNAPSPQIGLKFLHAPISHFAIDKLKAKGPRKNADVGQPHDSTRPLATEGSVSTGSWWCAAGGWSSPTPRATTEVFYVLEGHACVTDVDGTQNFFGPGDVVILPKGWAGRWDVLQDIHKVWAVIKHPDVEGSTKAVVKHYNSFSPDQLTSNGVRADASNGSPITASDTYLNNGHMSVGSWTCTPGSFPVSSRLTTEAFHLLEGICFITNDDGTAQRCTTGDTVVLPKGWSGHWDIIETVKKIWIVSE
eukprot:CAMPEP_0117751776 /NCGR_PEP_ID=MMETSP0947-20121206/11186_1 /TAXON_ID=44440 /ORGANISM="Chattonella subsalsa, Strain CCMP2191" /LENGTH=585 /DNA_ID=CAMNT_0005570241 /DNA_START=67 /DNA_END=1824 /DNA_ORIENTATION=-